MSPDMLQTPSVEPSVSGCLTRSQVIASLGLMRRHYYLHKINGLIYIYIPFLIYAKQCWIRDNKVQRIWKLSPPNVIEMKNSHKTELLHTKH